MSITEQDPNRSLEGRKYGEKKDNIETHFNL